MKSGFADMAQSVSTSPESPNVLWKSKTVLLFGSTLLTCLALKPVGGIARFQTLCNHYRSDEKYQSQPSLITLFSGDAFNPSLESSVTKGVAVSRVPKTIEVLADY